MKRTYLFAFFGVFLFTSCCKKSESDSNPDKLEDNFYTFNFGLKYNL